MKPVKISAKTPAASEIVNLHAPATGKKQLYTAPITRDTPCLILIMVDQSGSMSEPIAYAGAQMSKAEAVAQVINQLLEELLLRCRKPEGIRDYFQISVLGYGGYSEPPAYMAWEGRLAGRHYVLPSELNRYPLKTEKIAAEKLIRGRAVQYEKEIRSWISPLANYHTPMYAAICSCGWLVKNWITSHQGKNIFPAIIFNITDGNATDADGEALQQAAADLRALSTVDGPALFFNCHLSSFGNEPVAFPSHPDELPQHDEFARLLFEMSSELPPAMAAQVQATKGSNQWLPFRGMIYNTGIADLVKLINIGTSTSYTRLIE